MKIGELARRTGIAASAIRFYEANGLLSPAVREENGYRVFGQDTIERLFMIQTGQKLGFSLESIKGVLATSGGLPHDEILARMRERLSEMDRMQEELARQRSELCELMGLLEREWSQGRCVGFAPAAPPAETGRPAEQPAPQTSYAHGQLPA
jgi:DNA-binding transcriptional MerR regulator